MNELFDPPFLWSDKKYFSTRKIGNETVVHGWEAMKDWFGLLFIVVAPFAFLIWCYLNHK